MPKPNHYAVDAWASLVRAHRAALGGIEAALKAAGMPPLEWYDALYELRRAKSALKLRELERRMLLPQYNISRLADRLVAAGHARKHPHPDDGRSRVLTITPKGQELLRAMWSVYGPAIQRTLGDRLTDEEAKMLAASLRKIANPPGDSTPGLRAPPSLNPP